MFSNVGFCRSCLPHEVPRIQATSETAQDRMPGIKTRRIIFVIVQDALAVLRALGENWNAEIQKHSGWRRNWLGDGELKFWTFGLGISPEISLMFGVFTVLLLSISYFRVSQDMMIRPNQIRWDENLFYQQGFRVLYWSSLSITGWDRGMDRYTEAAELKPDFVEQKTPRFFEFPTGGPPSLP